MSIPSTRYEDLVRDPAAYFKSIFSSFSLPESYFDEAAVNRMQGKSSGGNFKFKLRDPLRSKYYEEGYFRQYAALAGPSATLAGYEDHGGRIHCHERARPCALLAASVVFAALIHFGIAHLLWRLDPKREPVFRMQP